MPQVFITIVTYNGREYVEDLFASLHAHAAGVDIIVVDNASSDGTADWIAEHAPGVELIRNSENLGFTGGQNLAMRRAIDQGADFVFLLNQDTVVAPGFLNELLEVAAAYPKAAAIQPLLLLYGSNPEQVNSWGNAQHYLGFGYAKGYKHLVADAPQEVVQIPYASGAAVLYRVDVLKKTGLFPEHFFMYQEDLDLVWRMRLLGYEILLAPKSRVYHKYDWQGAAKKYGFVERNRLATVFTNYHWATLMLLIPGLVLAEVGLLVSSLFTGWFEKKIDAYRLFFSAPYQRALWAARRHAQSLRLTSDRSVTAPFTSLIAFQEAKSPITRFILNPCFWLYFRLVRIVMFW